MAGEMLNLRMKALKPQFIIGPTLSISKLATFAFDTPIYYCKIL